MPQRSDRGVDRGRRENTARARLRALTELELDHADLLRGGLRCKTLRVEAAERIAAAEIAAPDLPHQITSRFAMIGADAAFAGIMIEEIGRASCRERVCQEV